jgi:hypothetical protein
MLAMVRAGSGSPFRFHARKAGDLPIPLERRTERVERGQCAVDDLGSDAVPGNEGRGNLLCHRSRISAAVK